MAAPPPPAPEVGSCPIEDKAELSDTRLLNSVVRSSVHCWVQRIEATPQIIE